MSRRRWGGGAPLYLSPHLTILLFPSNHTLRFMSFPVSDISQAYRSAPERTEDVWQKVRGRVLKQGEDSGGGGGGAGAARSLSTDPSPSIASRSSGAW